MSSFRPNTLNYKDFDIDFNQNQLTGDIKTRAGLSSISQSIKNIILTSPTERPFMNFGAAVYTSISDSVTSDDFLGTRYLILGMLQKYEPRIVVELDDIQIIREKDGETRINITYGIAEGLGIDKQTLNILVQ